MKIANERDKLKGLSEKELSEKVNFYKRELFGIRLNSRTAHVKDYSQFKKLKRNVARALTYLSVQKSKSQRGNG